MHFLSVCKEPIYIEAREVSTEKDWIGSNSLILHQVKNTEDWAFGLSKDFGWVGKIECFSIFYELNDIENNVKIRLFKALK